MTKTNWEGVGVQPDSSVNQVHALVTAHQMVLLSLSAQTSTDERRQELAAHLDKLSKWKKPLVPVTFELRGFETAKEVFVVGN